MAYNGITADFPCGLDGLDGNQNVFRVSIEKLIKARNIRYDGNAWRRAPGLAKFDSNVLSGTPTCLAGIDWNPVDGTQKMITAWDNGSVFKEVSGDVDNVTLVSGLTLNKPTVFVEGGNLSVSGDRKLYMYSQNAAPQVLNADGSTMAGITNESGDWSSDKPAAAIYHDSRIFAWGNKNAPHNIYISTLNDHGDFTGAGSRISELRPGQGERITAMFSHFADFTKVFVFKFPRGVYVLDTANIAGFFLPNQVLRLDVGMAGPLGIAKAGEDIFFISSTGRLYSMRALRPDIDLKDADITALLNLEQYVKDNVDLTRLASAQLHYDESRKELWYCYTSKDDNHNDAAIIFDVSEPGNPRVAIEDRGPFFEAMFTRRESDGSLETFVAGEGGLVYRANQVSRNVGGSSYVSEFQYPDTDLKFASTRETGDIANKLKRFDWLEISVTPTGDYDISFEIIIDGKSTQTVTINLGAAAGIFDTGVFGTAKFGGQDITTHKVKIGGIGTRIGLRGSNSGLNQDFSISNIRLFFQILGTEGEN